MNRVEVKRRRIQTFADIFGLFIIIVIGRITGDNGFAYLTAAYLAFLFFDMVINACIPDAMGRLIKSRYLKNQYKNAELIEKAIMLYQCLTGLAGSLLLYALSGVLETYVLCMPYSSLAMKIMAPAILIRSVYNVMLGYFQGNGSYTPRIVIGILQRLFLLGFGVLFSNIFLAYGSRVSALLKNDAIHFMYGGAGFALAYLSAEVLSLLFVLIIYLRMKRDKGRTVQDGLKLTETIASAIRSLYGIRGADLLIQILTVLPLFTGLIIYQRSVPDIHLSAVEYGSYAGKYLSVCLIPVCLILFMLYPMCARLLGYLRKEDQRMAGELFGIAVHLGFVESLSFSVLTAVLSAQIAGAVFLDGELFAVLLKNGSVLILLIVFSSFFLMLLKQKGNQIAAICLLAVGNVVFITAAILLLNVFSLGINALVYAGLAGCGVLCFASGIIAFRQVQAGVELINWLIIPMAAIAVTGLVVMFLGKAFTPHLGNGVAALLCFFVGILLYWLILLLLRSFRREELKYIPGGNILIWLGQIMRIYK